MGRGRNAETDRLIKDQLQLEKEVNAQGETRYRIIPVTRELSFDKGFYVFVRALQLLTKHNKGCIVVGLAGASGSGKTTFTQRVKSTMSNIAVLSMDMYNDGTKVRENNFDDPRLTDYDLLLENLLDLKAGRPCQAPVYDFKSSKRSGFVEVPVPASRIILVEGIYALSARLAPLLDLRVAITGGIHFDLVKRVMRDINRSGQEANEIIQQISDTVYPMYKVYIEPDLKAAHIKIYNNFNPFAGFKDPIYILKTEDSIAPSVVRQVLAEKGGVEPLSILEEGETEAYDIFLLPPGEDIQECQSWLRMRNKEGRYTLMFAEWFVNEPFIISPRISFEVPVKLLGGLMALGYTIGSIMSRKSVRMGSLTGAKADVSVKWDRVEKLGCFMQIQGSDRDTVMEVANKLNITHFVPRSYIEQVQLLKLTQDFTEVNEEARRRFAFDKDAIIDDHVIGASPARQLVFHDHLAPAMRVRQMSDTLSVSVPAHRHTWDEGSTTPSRGERLLNGRGDADAEAKGRDVAQGLLSQQLRGNGQKPREAAGAGKKGDGRQADFNGKRGFAAFDGAVSDIVSTEGDEVFLKAANGDDRNASNSKLPSFWREGSVSDTKSNARSTVEDPAAVLKAVQLCFDQLHRDAQTISDTLRTGFRQCSDASSSAAKLSMAALTGCAVGAAVGCALTLLVLSARPRT